MTPKTDPAVVAEQKKMAAGREKERKLSLLSQEKATAKQSQRLTTDINSVYGGRLSMFGGL